MVYNYAVKSILMGLVILTSLTPRQEVYLIKQIFPDAQIALLLSEDSGKNENAAQYVMSGPLYHLTVIPLDISSARKASEILSGAISRHAPDVIILTEEKMFEDPMLMRLIVSKALEGSVPILAANAEQVKMGATFCVSSTEDDKILISYNKISTVKLHIDFPESELYLTQELKE